MCEVPEWDGPPDTAGMPEHGRWRWCHTRATHQVTYQFHGSRTEACCDAHVAELVRRGENHRAFMRVVERVDVPAPAIVRVIITPDARAAAHGHSRFILTKEPLTGPWQPAMIPTGPTPLPTPPARRRRAHTTAQTAGATSPVSEQFRLF